MADPSPDDVEEQKNLSKEDKQLDAVTDFAEEEEMDMSKAQAVTTTTHTRTRAPSVRHGKAW